MLDTTRYANNQMSPENFTIIKVTNSTEIKTNSLVLFFFTAKITIDNNLNAAQLHVVVTYTAAIYESKNAMGAGS